MEALSGEDRRCMYSLLACHIVDARAGVIQSSIVEAGSALPPSPSGRPPRRGKARAAKQQPNTSGRKLVPATPLPSLRRIRQVCRHRHADEGGRKGPASAHTESREQHAPTGAQHPNSASSDVERRAASSVFSAPPITVPMPQHNIDPFKRL